MKTIVCATSEETEALGKRLASLLTAPAFLALYGDLGAGKTAFVRGMGAFFGTSEVRSPTFTIVQEHETKPRLIHFDVYRLADEQELNEIGFTDYLAESAILVMEWADRVKGALPRERLEISIVGSGDEPRSIEISAVGERFSAVEEAL